MIRKSFKILALLMLLLSISLLIAGFFVNKHLASNKPKILENLGFLNGGVLSFESTSISIYKNFPSGTISLKNVVLKNSLFDRSQSPVLALGELNALFSLKDFWNQNIEINALQLKDGQFNLLTDTSGYNNFHSLFNGKGNQAKTSGNQPFWKKFKFTAKALDLMLSNIQVRVKNSLKTSSIVGRINQLQTQLNLNQENLTAQIQLSTEVKELVFKQKNGAFLADSELSGTLEVSVTDSLVKIDPFELNINDEQFLFSALLNTAGNTPSELILENKYSRFDKILPLLPKNIRQQLLPYHIPKPFYSKTIIQTAFKPKEIPIVEVTFKMDQQNLLVHKIPFNETQLSGRFINRIFDDKRKFREGKKRFRVILEAVNTEHKGFLLQTDKVLIAATKTTKPQIKSNVKISGQAKSISDWFQNDQFFFEKGDFNLEATVNGTLNDLNCLIIESNADLKLKDFTVAYQPAKVTFPFQEMTLRKEVGDAFFKIISSTFAENYDLLVDGGLKNLAALLFDIVQQKVTSQANVQTKKLAWTDFINLFGEEGLLKKNKPKSEREKKKSMKATLAGIYHNFQPSLSIQVDTLAYYDLLKLNHFQTGVHFEDKHTLVLEETSFEYDNGRVYFHGKLDISDPFQTPFSFELTTKNLNLKKALPTVNYLNINLLKNLEKYPEDLDLVIKHKGVLDDQKGLIPNTSTGTISFTINDGKTLQGVIQYEPGDTTIEVIDFEQSYAKTEIKLRGSPTVFNDFFKTENFIFEEGMFELDMDYQGNVGTVEQVLTNSEAQFSLADSYVFYRPFGVTFPMTAVQLELNEDVANFNFFMNSDSLGEAIHFEGNIDNISELVIGNTGKSLKTEVDISSDKITWANVINIFASEDENDDTGQTMKASMRGILNTFDPHFHVNIDTFQYSENITLNDFHTGVHLNDSVTLILERTTFDFSQGQVRLAGEFNLGKKLVTPFKSTMTTANVDLGELVKNLDYLALPSLKGMKKLDGVVNMKFDLEGIIDDYRSGLIGNASQGKIDFDLQNVLLVGLEPLDAIAARLRMEKRFQEVRFAPIQGEIKISGQEILFPKQPLEIQSNAIHLFLEGTLSYGDLTNLWVSIPINNLQRTNRFIIPDKTGYAAAKRKVYIEVTSDEVGNNQFKFRLSKRKFYKSRGILDQFRLDKKRDRATRRALRKNKSADLTQVYSED